MLPVSKEIGGEYVLEAMPLPPGYRAWSDGLVADVGAEAFLRDGLQALDAAKATERLTADRGKDADARHGELFVAKLAHILATEKGDKQGVALAAKLYDAIRDARTPAATKAALGSRMGGVLDGFQRLNASFGEGTDQRKVATIGEAVMRYAGVERNADVDYVAQYAVGSPSGVRSGSAASSPHLDRSAASPDAYVAARLAHPRGKSVLAALESGKVDFIDGKAMALTVLNYTTLSAERAFKRDRVRQAQAAFSVVGALPPEKAVPKYAAIVGADNGLGAYIDEAVAASAHSRTLSAMSKTAWELGERESARQSEAPVRRAASAPGKPACEACARGCWRPAPKLPYLFDAAEAFGASTVVVVGPGASPSARDLASHPSCSSPDPAASGLATARKRITSSRHRGVGSFVGKTENGETQA